MMRALAATALVALVLPATAGAHLPHPTPLSLQEAKWDLAHARKAHPAAVPWLRGVIRRKTGPTLDSWAAIQIHYATLIARSSSADPWPNCPDPFDGGGSWFDTVKCENRGMYERYGFPRAWLDSPGYYRCGLQFDPGWERHYGRRFCP